MQIPSWAAACLSPLPTPGEKDLDPLFHPQTRSQLVGEQHFWTQSQPLANTFPAPWVTVTPAAAGCWAEHIDFSQDFNNPELQFAYWLFCNVLAS